MNNLPMKTTYPSSWVLPKPYLSIRDVKNSEGIRTEYSWTLGSLISYAPTGQIVNITESLNNIMLRFSTQTPVVSTPVVSTPSVKELVHEKFRYFDVNYEKIENAVREMVLVTAMSDYDAIDSLYSALTLVKNKDKVIHALGKTT